MNSETAHTSASSNDRADRAGRESLLVERFREAEEVACDTPTVAGVLRRAAYLLEEFGWRQGSAGSRVDGSMCAVGAIMEAAEEFGLPWFNDVERQACAINGWPSESGIWPLALWNDAPGRTSDEVISRLREAAGDA